MKVLKSIQYSLVVLSACLAFTSCTKDSTIAPNQPANGTAQDQTSFFSVADQRSNSSEETDSSYICLEFVYPLTIIYSDGASLSVNSEEELDTAIDQWFDQNPESEDYPSFQYPLSVTQNGQTTSVNSEEELCDLYSLCYEDEDFEEGYDEEMCFEITYPIQINFPDGTSIAVNSDEEHYAAIEDYYENNMLEDSSDCPMIEYPIQVTLDDGTTLTVNSDDELYDLYDNCFEEEFEDCLTFNYPMDIQIPGGDVVTANNDDELWDIIDSFFEINPESEEYPMFVFPITVTMDDGSANTVNSEEELDQLFESCYDEEDGKTGSSIIGELSKSKLSKAPVYHNN